MDYNEVLVRTAMRSPSRDGNVKNSLVEKERLQPGSACFLLYASNPSLANSRSMKKPVFETV
jgi:hypothetical protein